MSYKLISPIPIKEGGTNAQTMATTDGVVYFDGTRLVTTAVGTAADVLTSNGPGLAPTFQAPAASSITIDGDTGASDTGNSFTFTGGVSGAIFTTDGGSTITESFNFLSLPATTSTDGQILINAVPYLHAGVSGLSTFLGGAGNFTGDNGYNIAAGPGTLFSITTASGNIVLGGGASGGANSLTSGAQNIIIGQDSLCGDNYTNENNNLLLNSAGVIGDSAVIRIFSDGGGTPATKCFIGGIDGINVGSTATVVTEASNQLGTAVITAGTNISITPGANTITIAGTGAASFSWSVITANQTAAVNNGYFCNKGSTLALALPAVSAVGDVIEVTNENTALGVQFTQAAGQQILFSTTNTTLGATGTLTSSAIGDTLKIVCKVANTIWRVTSSVGNWTPA